MSTEDVFRDDSHDERNITECHSVNKAITKKPETLKKSNQMLCQIRHNVCYVHKESNVIFNKKLELPPQASSINTQYCQAVFDHVLEKFYPTICDDCKTVMTRTITNRPYSLRCSKCLKQKSKLSHTPFRNLRLPQWQAGWLIEENFIRSPKVVTSLEISKRLGISYKSALLLKRRIQTMACDFMPAMKQLIWEDLEQEFPEKNFKLPHVGNDVKPYIQGKNVVHGDTMVLYSMKDRYGRKRHKSRGLTSSIYRSFKCDKKPGEQVGTLVHQMTNGKWVLLDSIPNLTANTVGPIIKKSLPRNTAFFTDEGYTFLYRIFPNHRMVNHSLKSKDVRAKFSKNRWNTIGNVNSQKSEGMNGSLKTAFRSYTYINPKFSKLYLEEWSFFKNLKYISVEDIAYIRNTERSSENRSMQTGSCKNMASHKSTGCMSRNDEMVGCGDKGELITLTFLHLHPLRPQSRLRPRVYG